MAANTVTSKTSTVVATGTDIAFTATHKLGARPYASKVFVCVKYTKAVSDCVMTFDLINASLSATDKYRLTWQDANDDIDVVTWTIAATANRRFAIDICPGETSLVVNIALATTDSGDACVINFVEE